MPLKNYLQVNGKPASKYGNVLTEYGGYTYMSKKEANYARELDTLKKAKASADRVVSYERQVPYKIEINGVRICKYILDFLVTYADGHIEYVDVKGVRTTVYALKCKMMLAVHGIAIKEV